MPEAARVGDPIGHTQAMNGLLAGLVMGAIVGAAIVATGGAALPFIVAGAVAGAAAGGGIGEVIGSMSFMPLDITGAISIGSPNVIINGRPAVPAHIGMSPCSKNPPLVIVAQGSATVLINGQPAARKGDLTVCSAKVAEGSSNVLIGGGTVTTDKISPEIPDWVNKTLMIAGFAATCVLAGPLVAVVGFAGGMLGGELGSMAGGAMFGEGSDGQKICALLGSIAGGMGAAKMVEMPPEVPVMREPTPLAEPEPISIRPTEPEPVSVRPSEPEPVRATSEEQVPRQGKTDPECCGDPIDVISGQVRISVTDFILPGVLPVTMERTYCSDFEETTALGHKWRCTWGAMIQDAGFNGVSYVTADGLNLKFNTRGGRDVGGWLSNASAPKVKLRRTASGYEVRERDRTSLLFEHRRGDAWLLTEIGHPNGHSIHLTRARDGAVQLVEHSGGYRLHVTGTASAIEEISLELSGGRLQRLVRYEYDRRGNLAGIVNGSGLPLRYEYDLQHRITKWTDREGTWYGYEYDADGRVSEATGSASVFTARFHYDPARRTTNVENAAGQTTSYVYDDAHNVIEKRDALGGVTRTRWNLADQKTAETDPNGNLTRFEYDWNGNLITFIDAAGHKFKYAYNRDGLPTEFIDADGRRWLRVYDERGNIISAGLESKTPWRYERDFAGNLTGVIDPEGHKRSYLCDTRGLPIQVTDARGGRTTYTRDGFGRVVAETNALGIVTAFSYNELNKLSDVKLPDGSEIHWDYNPEGLVTRRVAQDGTTYKYSYGAFDKLAQVEKPSGGRFRFAYDTEARVQAVENERGEVYRYGFDELGRVISETDFTGRKLQYEYDSAGFCTKRINGKGEWTAYSRDPLGRVIAKLHSDGSKETFRFEASGNLLEAANSATTLRFERDDYGRVTREQQGEHWIESGYDAAGRRTHRQTSFGSSCEWSYDPNGQIAALNLPNSQELLFTHDELGRETSRRFGPDFVLRQSYDVMSRITEQAGGDEIRRQFRYDVMSNPVEIADRQWGSSRFTYDADGRLTSSSRESGIREGFEYDAAGNIASVVRRDPKQTRIEFKTRMLAAGGRLEVIEDTKFFYDRDGRLTEKWDKKLIWKYEWSVEGRLLGVLKPNGERWRYEYDPLGRRIRKTGPTGTTEYLWDGATLAEEANPHGKLTSWFYAPGSFRPIAKVENGTAYACVTDQVGTPKELVAADGTVAWSGQLTAYGETDQVGKSATDCALRFQGQYWDEETGLHYNWNRYYEPGTGQYLSSDPIGLSAGTRTYGYVHNPASWVDPFGLAGCAYVDDQGVLNIKNKFPSGSSEDIALQQHVADWNQQIQQQGGTMTRQAVTPAMRAAADDAAQAARAANPPAYPAGTAAGHTPDVGWGGSTQGPINPLPSPVNSYIGGATQAVPVGTTYNGVVLY